MKKKNTFFRHLNARLFFQTDLPFIFHQDGVRGSEIYITLAP